MTDSTFLKGFADFFHKVFAFGQKTVMVSASRLILVAGRTKGCKNPLMIFDERLHQGPAGRAVRIPVPVPKKAVYRRLACAFCFTILALEPPAFGDKVPARAAQEEADGKTGNHADNRRDGGSGIREIPPESDDSIHFTPFAIFMTALLAFIPVGLIACGFYVLLIYPRHGHLMAPARKNITQESGKANETKSKIH